MSCDVVTVKIGAGVFAVGRKKHQKLAESLDSHFAYLGGEVKGGGENRIVIKFYVGRTIPDVITQANLGDNCFWKSGGQISHFSIDLRCGP